MSHISARRRTALASLALTGALTAGLLPALAPPASANASANASADASANASADSASATRGRLQQASDRMVADGQPGVIIMSRRGGRVTHVTAGVADKATGTPMDRRLRFRIASVTKTFTSTVVLQLVAERRLSLDDTVNAWLPGAVTRNGNDGSKITVRRLLAHTSGLSDYTRDPRVMTDPRREWKPQELVDIAQETQPVAQGTYSNTNYVLLGMIIEKATGRSVGAEFQRRIIGPLGLRHTSLPTSGDRSFPGPYVHGYWGDYGDVSTEISMSSAWTSGGIISTVDDVARFHRALYTGRLLPRHLQREMMTTGKVDDGDVVQDYGLGAVKTRFTCGVAWGHDGGFPGYRTWAFTSADGRRQAVITYNENGPKMEADPAFNADLRKATETAFCG